MSSFQTFLDEVAEAVLIESEDTSRMKIIFPNRRAGLFFQQRLARMIKRPLWSPEIITMETFVQSHTATINADPLTLIFELYRAFIEVQGSKESFEKFYFWGEMLLRDFEDIDQGMVASSQIFQGIKNQKEIDDLFYFLEEEDKKTIQSFWQSFFPESKEGHEQFLKTWKILHPVYLKFVERISKKGLSYTGLQYRQVAEQFQQGSTFIGR